jgi:uncharacterized membrane protein
LTGFGRQIYNLLCETGIAGKMSFHYSSSTLISQKKCSKNKGEMSMSYIWQNKHFIITHFPIVLLIVGFLFDLFALILRKREWNSAGMACLAMGTLGAIASVLTGPEGERNPGLPTHELFGKLTMLLAILLCVFRLGIMWRKKRDVGSHPIYLAGALAAGILVGITGHLGGKMVHRDPSQFHAGQRGAQMNQDGQGGQGGRGGQGGQHGEQPGASPSAEANT